MTYRLINEKVRDNLIKEIISLPFNKFEVTIKKIGKTRQQEKYWHKLVGIVADFQGEHPEEMKMKLKYDWLPLREIKTMSGEIYLYPVSTVKLKKEQYTLLIEKTLVLGNILGLKLPRPSDLGYDF